MFPRIRLAFGIALLVTLTVSITAFAKGGFSFITITGANLKDELRVTDPELTTDFFAFADFSRNKAEAPANPGEGYEITRYYIDGKSEVVFDRLHYYPETGLVYYDGIVNGSSDYDGEWYIARREIKAAFEKVLPGQVKSIAPAVQQPDTSPQQAKSTPSLPQAQPITLIAITAGLVAILLLGFWLRRSSAR